MVCACESSYHFWHRMLNAFSIDVNFNQFKHMGVVRLTVNRLNRLNRSRRRFGCVERKNFVSKWLKFNFALTIPFRTNRTLLFQWRFAKTSAPEKIIKWKCIYLPFNLEQPINLNSNLHPVANFYTHLHVGWEGLNNRNICRFSFACIRSTNVIW